MVKNETNMHTWTLNAVGQRFRIMVLPNMWRNKMKTYNWKDENLEFNCNSCNSKIEINPESIEDMNKLGDWFFISFNDWWVI